MNAFSVRGGLYDLGSRRPLFLTSLVTAPVAPYFPIGRFALADDDARPLILAAPGGWTLFGRTQTARECPLEWEANTKLLAMTVS